MRYDAQSKVFGSHTITLGAIVASCDSLFVPLSRSIKSCTVPPRSTVTDKQETESPETRTIRDIGCTIPSPHRSIITFMAQSWSCDYVDPIYACCDWNGLVSVYDHDWNLKYTFQSPHPPAAAVKFLSRERLVVLGRGKDNFNPGCVALFQLGEERVEREIGVMYDNVWQVACYDNHVYVWKWLEPVFSLLKYNNNLELIGQFEMMSERSAAIGHAINYKYVVLAFQSRDLALLDRESLHQIPSPHIRAVSKSPIWGIQFVNETNIVVQYSCEEFVVLDVTSGVVRGRFTGPGTFVCFMELRGDCMWLGTVDGVFRLDFTLCPLTNITSGGVQSQALEDQSVEEIQDDVPVLCPVLDSFLYHEVSCCGVCVSGNHVISGDLSGNILVWEPPPERAGSEGTSPIPEPIYRTSVADSVRCLCPLGGPGQGVLAGTLGGILLYWRYELSPETHTITRKEDTITCIKTRGERLCFGLVTGSIELWSFSDGDPVGTAFTKIFSLRAHEPSVAAQTDPRFGSLRIKAEVWSLAFSPNGDQVATCSEDQTVKITCLESLQNIDTYRDHTLAVTCVAWEEVHGLSLLVSCSDDNIVVVRDTIAHQTPDYPSARSDRVLYPDLPRYPHLTLPPPSLRAWSTRDGS